MRKLWPGLLVLVLVLVSLVLSACGGKPAAPTAQPGQPTEMQHSADPMSDNSYDVHFIDSILDHHAAVLVMTQQALTESSSTALKDLAQQTMTVTQQEIDWLTAYRQKEHTNAAKMVDEMNMGPIGIGTDSSKSFEQRYAEAMITHHQGSIDMAKEALAKLGHEELKKFAETLIAQEEAEITQLQQFIE